MRSRLTAVVGAGGKTSALRYLARTAGAASVLLTTTTHIFPFAPPECRCSLTDPEPEALFAALRAGGVVCAGRQAREGKLAGLEPSLLSGAVKLADLTLCEADGAHRLPLKLHRPDEPVMPEGTDCCLVVAGLAALGRPVGETVHRYERNPRWREQPETLVTPEEFLTCVLETAAASGMPKGDIRVFLNQADALETPEKAEAIAKALRAEGYAVRWGSLRSPEPDLAAWILE